MTTSLGGSNTAGILMAVYNDDVIDFSAGAVIKNKSTGPFTAAFYMDLAVPADFGLATRRQIDIPIIRAALSAVDSATTGQNLQLGIAIEKIPIKKVGLVMVLGCCRVILNAPMAAGVVLASAAGGIAQAAVNANHRNPFGYTIAASTVDGPLGFSTAPCIVDFTSRSGAGAAVNYNGIPY